LARAGGLDLAPKVKEASIGHFVLLTGGAGFIGSHVADELLRAGHRVRILDNLSDQVHGGAGFPSYLDPSVELVKGDIRDTTAVASALRGVDAVLHLAARVGVGQSMYEIASYTDVNGRGTSILLEALVDRPVERLVVASSMSVYGEGAYVTAAGAPHPPGERTRGQLERGEWELLAADGSALLPVATPETKQPSLSSVYALTKYDQERLCLIFGRAYGVPTVALRFFNAYGPRQALSNPYTGVLAIFASRLLNGKPPLVYEDGLQRRDFISVYDVARACRLALESDGAAGEALNVGTGCDVTVLEIARQLATLLDVEIEPTLGGKYRAGDIRHCFADTTLARELLGFQPQVTLEQGMAELAEWLEGRAAVDHVEHAAQELALRGLTV
jgi:dTDP-L-rhamnose 4-epimerase